MSGKKISQLTVSADLATNDRIEFVDVSDTSMGPGGTNKAVTLNDLVGRVLFVTPGSITAGKALVADNNGEIAGVSASELQRLDVSAGSWTNNRALVVDGTGSVAGVTSAQFAALNVAAGSWTNNRALVVNNAGTVAGVSDTQFGALNVTAGVFSAGRAVVLNSGNFVGNARVKLDVSASPYLSFEATTTRYVRTTDSAVTAKYDANTGTFSASTLVFNDGTYTTTYGRQSAQIVTANGNIELNAAGSPAFLRIQLGSAQCYMTRNSLIFQGAAAGTLDIRLEGLPTSAPAENYRLWVDTSAGNVLKIKLP